METRLMFLDCPAYLDRDGSQRCGLPAEVRCRFMMRSTDGPLESAMIRCPAGHWFNGPIEFLTLKTEPGRAAAPPCWAAKDGGRKEWPPR
jgi:hypothetical protein